MKDGAVARSGWFIAAVAAVSFLVKLLLALKTYGTNDVYTYDQFSFWSRYLGVSLYHIDPLFNHPPSMIHLLHALSWLCKVTGVPFSFGLRLPAIIADAANLWLVWKLLEDRGKERTIYWALILLAASPTLILVSGFHGNTDSVVMFFVLLSVYLVEKGQSAWLVGVVFGLAHCVKVYPLIAGPAIFLNLAGWSRKLKFCTAASVVLLAAWSPYFYQDPRIVIGQVFGYRSSYGDWGLSYILDQLTALAPRLTALNSAFNHFGAYISLGLVCLLSWRMATSGSRPKLFSQVGLVFLLFLSVSSGFGVQYLAWLAPWVVEQGWAAAALFYTTSGVFLFLVYNLWAQGFPWYLADSYNLGTFVGYFDHVQLICWCSLLVVLWLAWKRIATTAGWKRLLPFPPSPSAWRWAAGALAALAIYAIVPPQLPTPEPTGGKYDDAVRAINARSYLDLAGELSDRRRYQDSIEAAREAIALSPQSAPEAGDIIAADEKALATSKR